LRALTKDDYPRLVEFSNDLEVELAGGGDPPRPSTLESLSAIYDQLAKDKENVRFAIEVGGVFIGDMGLFHVNRVTGTAELGIGIGDKDYWGKGYGRDAIRLLVDYGFRLLNLRRIWLEVHGGNERGLRCYRAVGFVEEGRQREHNWVGGQYQDNVLMGLMRSDWNQAG
jgi:RimJ/RimL family protein N-acetyltransferase